MAVRVAVLMFVALVVFAGLYSCVPSQNPDANGTTDSPAGTSQKPVDSPAQRPPLFSGWETPAVAFLLSGEQKGYIEPCGCTANQMGGMSRRVDLYQQLGKKGWTTVGVDVGGMVNRGTRKQSKIKFERMLEGLKLMNYAAIALGTEELRLGADYLLGAHANAGLPFLSANIVLFDTPDAGTPLRHVIKTVGEVKIGITAVLGESVAKDVLPAATDANQPADIKVLPAKPALKAALEAIDAEGVQLRVLLAHGSLDEARQWAAEFPKFDLILAAGGPGEPDGKPILIGNTMLALVGAKGKHAGVVGYFPKAEKEKLRFEFIDLDAERFQNAPQMEAILKFYQDQLRDYKLAETDAELAHPSGAEFVGAKVCGSCHTKSFSKWSGTGHARAFESLIKGRKESTNWIPRQFDAECLACHVTGWHPQEAFRFKTGFVNETVSAHLLGQQCENCHGPGSDHVKAELVWKKTGQTTDETIRLRKLMHLDQGVAERKICVQCHDGDNSPKFKFAEYWEKVKHPGRD